MRIGEVAERAGVSARLVRYYEQQGLIEPIRLANGYREYDESHVERVQRIAGLVQSGLTTKLVKQVMGLEDTIARDEPGCPRSVADALAAELVGLEAKIACLSRSRDTIRDYLARSEHAALLLEIGAEAS
ncbi:MerR family transcriptional regulator [Agromyces seonyuensis]|uniref:MerR family transcriptional regulator n=1 Tax=Agromyces seonyuensis TaxID=2662446 RepID=A0A6I4P330_9MICO|nr:MerR family transcriptional regulator [Agromyces seonyuensis]MWB98559.1 MerR family transcriptional regulator [Agromyces seonyuensis]